jgi:uncharacterized repeat protein (TIGR04076 family)
MAKVKITVVERTLNREICEEYGSEHFLEGGGCNPCTRFEDGQEFVLQRLDKPEEFCSWAWADIHREIRTVAMGGGMEGYVNAPQTMIACCTDGMKPVVFKIERIND